MSQVYLRLFLYNIRLQNDLTCLDLSALRIAKCDGIETLTNLHALRLADNALTSVKLKALHSLQFLDISGNSIAKLDELPDSLVDLRASRNALTCLSFCGKLSVRRLVGEQSDYANDSRVLQLLSRLEVARNKIKSLKGIEAAKMLEIFIASDNQIKERNEIDIFSVRICAAAARRWLKN